ncbi:unnamed protein product [Caenorhabditis sp. 36 PRJEB53466]|nr:unnamed protein product [Caenorhabditis sp. 36 PRJEB53466]
MSSIADVLVDHGHDVVVFQPQIIESLREKKVIRNAKVKIVNYEADENGKEFYRTRPKSTVTKYWTTNQAATPSAADQFAVTMSKDLEHMCLQMFRDKSLHEQLKSENFDVIIAEPFDPCGLYLGDFLQIPSTIVAMASSRIDPVQWAVGQPSGLNFIPGPGSRYGPKSTIWDRVNNIWMFMMRTRMFRTVYWNLLDTLRADTGLQIKHIDAIVADSAYLFFNSNPYLDFPFPSLTKCVPIGGFSMNLTRWKSEKLPEYLEKVLETRQKTVYISFGSVIRSADMPEDYKNGLIETFKSLPEVSFVWKYEEDDEEFKKRLPENVYLGKWLPQPALLADNRVNLFVTHGGLGSIMEVAYSGKPSIVVPLFFDQPMNGEMLARHGGAEVYSKFDLLDSVKITEVLKRILYSSEYQVNAERLSELLRKQPIDPIERLVKHAEFASEFKKLPELDPYSRHLSFAQAELTNDSYYDYLDVLGSTNVSLYEGMPFDEELCGAEECLINKTWTSDEKCAYIKCNPDSCEGGGYLQWSQYVKCQYNIGVRVVLIILGIIYLIILFIIMSSIADDFFCPAISGIVKHLRMSESIAGVTFLAFGNGAPDVFSSISSVLTSPTPKADLALGDLFGTSIFVTTVVLAIIILTKSFRVAIIPTLRDLIFYMITLAFIVFCFIKFDKIEVWMPATFLGIYGVYVGTVILLSILRTRRKKKRNPKKQRKEEEEEEEGENSSRPSSSASTSSIYGAMRLKEERISLSALFHFMIGYSQFIRNLNTANRRKQKIEENNENGGYVNRGFTAELEAPDSVEMSDEESGDEGREEEFVYAHGTVYTSHDQASIAATELETVEVKTWKSWDWVWDLLKHLKSWPSCEEFREMNVLVKIVAIVKIVPMFFMKMTIPSNEMSWCKPLFILQSFTSIQFALFSIQIISNVPFKGSPGLWLYGLAFSVILALIGMYFLPLHKDQKYYKEAYSYLGFLMSIAWIYATSNEIVGVVTMIGVVTGLSMELLGLTIMAWSNCIGDIVADIAVVKQGFPKMAMAAAIGGPLFNLLIGFGLPFTIAAAQGKEIELQINPVYRLLMLFLAISLVTTFVALFIERFTVRWPHAVALIFIFATFLIFICLAEFHVLEWK